MGVKKRVTRQLVDGGIVLAIAIGIVVAQQHGCFEKNDGPTPDEHKLPPCTTDDPWATGCEHPHK